MLEYAIADLPNKQAYSNKRAGRAIFFICYMKDCKQGGKMCHLLHETLRAGWIFFFKNAKRAGFLLGGQSTPLLPSTHLIVCASNFLSENTFLELLLLLLLACCFPVAPILYTVSL